jgi:hypothetical protein
LRIKSSFGKVRHKTLLAPFPARSGGGLVAFYGDREKVMKRTNRRKKEGVFHTYRGKRLFSVFFRVLFRSCFR